MSMSLTRNLRRVASYPTSSMIVNISATATSSLPISPGNIIFDLAHGHAGREQCTHSTTLVATARLDADRRDREGAKLVDEFGPAGGVTMHGRALLFRQDHNVQTILRYIDTAERVHYHLRIPFLLMRARARATVRVWKKRLELQAHSRIRVRNACGLPAATGVRS